jgi:hypothetical protein
MITHSISQNERPRVLVGAANRHPGILWELFKQDTRHTSRIDAVGLFAFKEKSRMSTLTKRMLIVGLVLMMAAMACSMPSATSTDTPENVQITQAAQTLGAIMTEAAIQTPVTPTPRGSATATAQGVTLQPSATQTSTVSGGQATQASATSKPQACDQAAFIDDVSVPDGSTLVAGSAFTKTWRLKNTGTCTWTADYALVFSKGSSMEGPSSQKLTGSVQPGQTTDITVPLKAPNEPGAYRGDWQLRNASGVLFGVGTTADTFYVDIKVVAKSSTSAGVDFAASYCLAEWTGNSTILPCAGKDGATEGFVLYKARPALENGSVDDEPGLITNPPKTNDGVIRGKYPTYTVQSGDHFVSVIGCEYNAKNCNVRFQLDYQIDNGTIQNIASWNEAYDGKFAAVDVDLASLNGKNVRFVLTVLSLGASDMDRAQWLLPRIVKVTPTPTPTITFTPTTTFTVTPTPTQTETPTPTATNTVAAP